MSYVDKAVELCNDKKIVFIYSAIKNELPTNEIIEKLLTEDKTVVMPRIESEAEMSCCSVDSFEDLEKGKFDILEPNKNCKLVDKSEVDIFFIPGTSFDRNGNRKGRGLGYFDRFLKEVKRVKVGVCPDINLKDRIVVKEWDVPVDYVLTEKTLLKCNKI